MVKLFFTLASSAALIPFCQAMDLMTQRNAVNTYRSWIPENASVRYRDAVVDDRVLQYIRTWGNNMRLAEMQASQVHRHFIMPLFMPLQDHDGVVYHTDKNLFAVFRLAWDSQHAMFDGIGSIDGVTWNQLAYRLKEGVDIFTPAEYGIILHIP